MNDTNATLAQVGNGLSQAVAEADDDIWKAIIIAGALALVGLWLYLKALHRSRMIASIPRSLLRSAAQGYVELHGEARLLPGEPILAPLSRKTCVWYSFSVEKKSRDSKGNTRWSTVDSGRSDDHFELRDDTGHCLVDPQGAEVLTDRKDRWYGETAMPTHGPDAKRSWFASDAYRYNEQRIEEQDPLFVWGNFQTRSLRSGINQQITELLRTWKADRATLIERFDVNRDGEIDASEWESARQAAADAATAQAFAPAGPSTMNLVNRPTEADRPYILSTQSESELLRGYRGQLWLGIALFLLGGAAFVWMIGIRLG